MHQKMPDGKVRTIVFIIDGLAYGGAEKVVLTLAGAMSRQGHDVTILSLREEQAYAIPDGVKLIKVIDNYRGPLRRQTEIYRRARQLDQVIVKHFAHRPIDLAISNLPKTDRIVAHSQYLQDARMCLHGAVASTQLAHKHGLKRWLKQRQLQRTYEGRNWITVSSGIGQDLIHRAKCQPNSIRTIFNPFDPVAIQRQAQDPCPLQDEHFIVHMGRFHPVKRHDRLLEAFAQSHYQGKLVLIGQGTAAQEQSIIEKISTLGLQSRVILAGFQSNPYPYLRSAEALIVSSDSEGFGNTIVEALICNTPVVSTDCPFGPREILTGTLSRGLAECNATSLAIAIDAITQAPPGNHPITLG
ncbi:glycosyltransferase [Paludibacterium sp. dN 18-1]|uniref:Glycosyltransferase n=2 Tax=Paludibacterium denitrificans TaxID=2675226 RepID=A0A844GDH2_9NEIS|nr:glycosyltransferase [Paludibacterium denitrificans]